MRKNGKKMNRYTIQSENKNLKFHYTNMNQAVNIGLNIGEKVHIVPSTDKIKENDYLYAGIENKRYLKFIRRENTDSIEEILTDSTNVYQVNKKTIIVEFMFSRRGHYLKNNENLDKKDAKNIFTYDKLDEILKKIRII